MKLLVTDECGRLARWLRLIGYDTAQTSAQSIQLQHLMRILVLTVDSQRAQRFFERLRQEAGHA